MKYIVYTVGFVLLFLPVIVNFFGEKLPMPRNAEAYLSGAGFGLVFFAALFLEE